MTDYIGNRYWPVAKGCDGPLVWFEAGTLPCGCCGGEHQAAVLECATCGYIVTTGNYHDDTHTNTPIMREGLAHG